MTGNRKIWLIAIAVVLASTVAGGLSGRLAYMRYGQGATDVQFQVWEHGAKQKEAQAYFRLMQILEGGQTNDLRRFRLRAEVILRGYVRDVSRVQKRYGSTWCPLDSQFYKQAQQYLADHPATATNDPTPAE